VATAVILVEKHPSAVKVIRSNIAQISPSLPASTTVSVVSSSVHLFLASAPRLQARGVFIDPPYEDESVHSVLAALPPWLAPGAWVAVERSTRSTLPSGPVGSNHGNPKHMERPRSTWPRSRQNGSHRPLRREDRALQRHRCVFFAPGEDKTNGSKPFGQGRRSTKAGEETMVFATEESIIAPGHRGIKF